MAKWWSLVPSGDGWYIVQATESVGYNTGLFTRFLLASPTIGEVCRTGAGHGCRVSMAQPDPASVLAALLS